MAPQGTTAITLNIPNPLYQECKAAAEELGTTTDHYITASLTIAHHLKLLQGTVRNPHATAIEPHLAAAIHQAAQGKPWQHQAELLLATPGHNEPGDPPPALLDQEPEPRHKHTADRLLTRYGLPAAPTAKMTPIIRINSGTLTRNQLLALLAIWDENGPTWTDRRVNDIGFDAGLPGRAIEPVIRVLIKNGHLEQKPNPEHIHTGTTRSSRKLLRIHPDTAAQLATGNLKPM